MKRLQKLRPTSKILTDFYVFDTETQGLRARPDAFIFGVVYGYNFTQVIYSVKDFQTEFKKPRYKGKKVFCHHAEYDLNVLYDNIYLLDAEAIYNGKFIMATNGNCIFADSMNIYPYAVKKIGEMLGLEKLDIDTNYIEGKRIEKVTKRMITYCIRDCQIVYDALLAIFEQAGDIRVTQASLAMVYFRKYHLEFTIEHNDNNKYFWNSYYGGRCEAFQVGHLKAVAYDINSMYPYAMKNAVFPNPKFLKKIQHIKPEIFIKRWLKKYEGCAEITVIHKDNFFGSLPLKIDKKLCFPVGTFSGWWNFNEIRTSLKHNLIEITEVKNVIYSYPMDSPFVSFVNDLYPKKENANTTMEKEVFKRLLNSLYGKFAQRIDTETIYVENVADSLDLIRQYKKQRRFIKLDIFNEERCDAFLVLSRVKRFDLSYTIPLFSSYITSFSRSLLFDSLMKYEKCNIVYCDTDSMFMLKEPKINESNKLGDWKKENKIVTGVFGLKNYSYIVNGFEFNKIKGIPKNAEKVGKNKYQYKSLIKTKEGLRRNMDAGIPVVRTKIINNKYDKRFVTKDGKTKPLKI